MAIDLSSSSVARLVNQGESDILEFKTHLPPDNVLARILIAFANTQGGTLLIGIGDTGEVVGLPEIEAERATQTLRKLSDTLCDWSYQIGTIDVNNKKIVYFTTDKAPPHLYPIMTSSGEVYIRRGASNVRLSEQEIVQSLTEKKVVDHFDHQLRDAKKPCIVFVAMSFREEQEPALVDYYKGMERAVKATELPFKLERMDLMEGDYEISQEIMNRIKKADIVIADFTLNSSNVYFELGYARGYNKRIIQTARKGTNLEFDIRSWRTIIYRNATELEEKLQLELIAAHAEVTDREIAA